MRRIKFELYLEGKRNGFGRHAVFKVYSDTETEREVYYEQGDLQPNYVGPHIREVVGKTLREVRK